MVKLGAALDRGRVLGMISIFFTLTPPVPFSSVVHFFGGSMAMVALGATTAPLVPVVLGVLCVAAVTAHG